MKPTATGCAAQLGHAKGACSVKRAQQPTIAGSIWFAVPTVAAKVQSAIDAKSHRIAWNRCAVAQPVARTAVSVNHA